MTGRNRLLPLSFPQVFSGNPASFSLVPSFVCPCWEKLLDSRLKTSGMTEGDAEGMSGMTEDLTEGMLDMSEGRSDLSEGKAGMTEGEGVPDFVGIAGSAVLLVLSCHACRVPPLSFPLGSSPSCLPVPSLTGVFLSGGQGVRRFGGEERYCLSPDGIRAGETSGLPSPRSSQARISLRFAPAS